MSGAPADAVCVAVALSGGRDSTALAHAVASVAAQLAQQGWRPRIHVLALHVHHGLSEHADAWLAHVQAACEAWASQGLPVRLEARHVHVDTAAGQGLEAAAREARHRALQAMAQAGGASLLLLAHHRRDQAETFLLQALRGAGLAGLAAMPARQWRDGICWARPWLDQPAEALEAWVQAHGLRHIDDDSNADPRFARNRLRHPIWPALLAAFPQAEQALCAAASHLGDAIGPMADWADARLADLVRADGTLEVAAWAEQATDARRLLLMAWHRRWVRQQAPGAVALGAHDVKRLADEVPRAWRRSGVGQWPHVGLSLYRGVLQAHAASAGRVVASTQEGCAAGAVGRAWALGVTGAGLWPLPAWGGMLEVTEATLSSGMAPTDEEVTQPLQALQSISLDTLRSLEVRPRSGGERYQMGPGRPPRCLRKQFQAAGVPAWARDVPLFWAGEQLVFVPGLGIDARAGSALVADTGPGATRSGPHFTLRWLPMAV